MIFIELVRRRGDVSHLCFIHLVSDADGVDLDALIVCFMCLWDSQFGCDHRHSVSDDNSDVVYAGAVSVFGRELHRTHVVDTTSGVRALSLVRDTRDGVHQLSLVVVRVQVQRVYDVSRISHDAHPGGGRPDVKLGHDVLYELQRTFPVARPGKFYASRAVDDEYEVNRW